MSPDDPRDLPDRDELASALLDGDLPFGLAEEARRDPAVLARMAELAAARDRLRATPVPPPDPGGRERALAAALAAFDDEGHAARRAGVADLGARREARAGGTGRVIRWLGVAAAVLALAGLASLASRWTGGGDSEDSTAGAALDEATSGGGMAREESAEDAGTSAGDRTAGEALAAVEDLGSFASGDDLVDRLRAEPDAQLPAPTSQPDAGADHSGDAESGQDAAASPPAAPACAAPAPAGGESVLRGRAVVAGTPVDVWVVTGAGGTRVVAVDASCRTVVDAPLP